MFYIIYLLFFFFKYIIENSMYFAWILYVGLIIVLYVMARLIIRYYIDPAETYNFAVISICVSFTVSMICILMVPIDVFVTSHPNDLIKTLQ